METIDKLPLTSLAMTNHQRDQLKAIFPEVFTENDQIDWDRLRLTLGEAVDTGKERFGLNWPGKADCFKTIQQPSRATLLPAPDEGVNSDETQNVFIEGDNLEVLKLLQKSYLGQVKMIYIDPPYNTGNDFIYPDNFGENLDTYLAYTGQLDEQGRRFATNTDTDGRFHSKWLNMMYPRLFLAKNLLREDGVIFISIDDNEVHNLRALCNEIFGEENFVASAVWQRRTSPDARLAISTGHEYILIYAKNCLESKQLIKTLPLTEEQKKDYKNPDNDPRGPWVSSDFTAQIGHATPQQFYTITAPNGTQHVPPPGTCWKNIESVFFQKLAEGRFWFGKDGNGFPRRKTYLSETEGRNAWTWWSNKEVGHNQEATKELKEMLNTANAFDNPKPVRLLKRMIQLATNDESIILDFFAGSATTAHAVLELNKEDGGNRKVVCVQLPEPTSEDSEAGKAGYQTIADISKERIRRVIKRIGQERAQLVEEIRQLENSIAAKEEQAAERQQTANAGTLFTEPVVVAAKSTDEQRAKKQEKIAEKEAQIDRIDATDKGFRVFKLAPSNFTVWDASVAKTPEAIQTQLFNHIDHIRTGATQADLLTELLLKSGFPLTTPVETLTLAEKTIYSVAEGELLVCLEEQLTPDVIKAIADRRPSRVICLDAGFQHNDPLKTNATLLMKDRGVVKFQTV